MQQQQSPSEIAEQKFDELLPILEGMTGNQIRILIEMIEHAITAVPLKFEIKTDERKHNHVS